MNKMIITGYIKLIGLLILPLIVSGIGLYIYKTNRNSKDGLTGFGILGVFISIIGLFIFCIMSIFLYTFMHIN